MTVTCPLIMLWGMVDCHSSCGVTFFWRIFVDYKCRKGKSTFSRLLFISTSRFVWGFHQLDHLDEIKKAGMRGRGWERGVTILPLNGNGLSLHKNSISFVHIEGMMVLAGLLSFWSFKLSKLAVMEHQNFQLFTVVAILVSPLRNKTDVVTHTCHTWWISKAVY